MRVQIGVCFTPSLLPLHTHRPGWRRTHTTQTMCSEYKSPLRDYLVHARNTAVAQPAHIYLGNEAADLDSIVCAIAFAYANHTDAAPTVPVVNVPREDLPLRRDVMRALTLAGLSATGEQLVFIDDLKLVDMLSSGARLTLLDHNELCSEQAGLNEYVTGIVDHHVDAGKHFSASPRVVEKVGSCATLVTELMGSKLNAAVAVLLLSAVLLDTQNMDMDSGKGTERDKKAIELLRPLAQEGLQLVGFDTDGKWQKRLFKMLKSERRSVDGMSVSDLLRKDLKVVSGKGRRLGLASVNVSVAELFVLAGKEGLAKCLVEFAEKRGLLAVLVLCNSTNGAFKREMCIADGVGDEIVEKMIDAKDGVLQLMNVERVHGVRWMQQGNCKASRKVISPIVIDVLQMGSV